MQLMLFADVNWPSSHCPGRSGAQESATEVNSWTVVIAVSNKQYFASDPGISSLLPASTKLWQATFTIQNLSSFTISDKYVENKSNKNNIYQNLRDADKVVLRKIYIVLET